MNTLPQLSSFKINFANSVSQRHPIHRLESLERYISLYGRNVITRVSFYINDSFGTLYKLILYNTEPNDRYRIEIKHYNNNRQLVAIDIQTQILIYAAVINLINSTGNLYDIFGRFIITPFQPINNSSNYIMT